MSRTIETQMPVNITSRTLFSLAICLTIFAVPSAADNPWSSFHGADLAGYVQNGKLPNSWSESDYRWTHELGSHDVGSPVVVGDKVFLLASKPSSAELSIVALRLTDGTSIWEKTYQHPDHHLHSRNTFASSTPACDDNNVFIAFSSPKHTYLKCLDHSGNEVWSRDFGSWQSQHGFGTSPRIVGNMIIMLNSQQSEQLKDGKKPGQSRMIAVDRKTGKTIWETPLATARSCYGVPGVYRSENGTQIIGANMGNGLFGLDIATGKMLWSKKVFAMRCCSTPVIAGDIAIGSSGSGGGGNHLVAVKIPSATTTQPKQIYRVDRGAPYVPTPALKDKMLFTVSDKGGIVSCIDSQSGKSHWSKRVGGNFGASPIVVGDKLLVISLSGIATILSASSDYKELGEVELGGPVGATPAYTNEQLILRVGEQLRCLDVSK